MGALHRALGALAAQLFFGQSGDHNRQLVRGQGVGVMQHRCDGQVFAAHRAVDHHLQAFDGGEHIHRTPVTAGAVVVEHIVELGLGRGVNFHSWCTRGRWAASTRVRSSMGGGGGV